MDWDLWGPSYNQESSYHKRPGCQCDFYFGYGLDVLEETALNEKSCVHVLRILITKADTEIDELEKDLVVLQSQLAWAEYEEWSEICGTALREKIDCLNISIQRLRNENEHDINVHLLMHREPAERIHEILKVLLKNCCLEKDEQPLDVIVKDLISDALEHATDLSDEKKKLSNFDSNIIIKEEIKEPTITPTEKCRVLNSSLKPQGKKTDYPETPADIIVRSSNVDASRHAGHSNGKKELSNSDSKIAREEVEEPSSIPTTEITILDSSPKPEKKRTDLGGKVKPANITVKGSSSDAPRHATGNSNENKNFGKSDSEVDGKEEVKEQNSTPADKSIILGSSLKAAGEGTNLPKTDKPANAIVKDSSSDALRYATGINGKKKLSNSGSRMDALRRAKGADSSGKDEGIKESQVALANKIDSSNPQQVKVQDAVTSLLELQVQSGKDTTKPQPEEEGIPQPEVQKVDIVANDKSNLKAKWKNQSNPRSVQDPSSLPMEIGANSKAKRRRKSGNGDDNATLVQFFNVKIGKKLVHPDRCGAKECGVAPDVSKNSVSQSLKKRKTSSVLPIVVEIKDLTFLDELLKLNGDTTDSASKKDNSDNEREASMPSSGVVNLNELTVIELKAIAKHYKLKKYHKLRRIDLVEKLAKRLG